QGVEQDRRGQVVGQVADQAHWRAGGQRGEVDVEHVGVYEAEVAVGAGRLGQRREQVAVELDRGQRTVAAQQRKGHRPLAGADLDDAVSRPRVDGEDDLLDHAAFVQEVLAQGFLGRSGEAAHSSRVPGGTSRSGTHSATRPASSWKPVTRHCDISGPICLGGKLTTPTTSRPTSSPGVYRSVTWALDLRRPISGPKSTSST